ncbi:MAG: hypothetical protein JXB88_03350, partial [Spirochaetales bacterium]|nr:hypothetical protein [Spirochaetales bacterium]
MESGDTGYYLSNFKFNAEAAEAQRFAALTPQPKSSNETDILNLIGKWLYSRYKKRILTQISRILTNYT